MTREEIVGATVAVLDRWHDGNRERKAAEIADAILALAKPGADVPEGWVRVPRDPTEAMWRAHWKALGLSPKEYKAWAASDCCKRGPHESACVSAWHAMIAAAPPPPSQPKEGER
jgi:hypothetical protein